MLQRVIWRSAIPFKPVSILHPSVVPFSNTIKEGRKQFVPPRVKITELEKGEVRDPIDLGPSETYQPPKSEIKKFSSFLSEEKEYKTSRDRSEYFNIDKLPKFEAKEEYTKVEFDPNIRLRLPKMPYELAYQFLYNEKPKLDPQSTYVAVHHNGKTWHLFNAARYPIGRIAALASVYIRGKHKPGYDPKSYSNGDKIVVVNMKDPLMTGRKRLQKLYRHHTGYPGGLKEFTFKHILETNPDRILKDAILGMLPKNKLRKDIVEKNVVTVFGKYHDYDFLP
jgi:large subunit ribosomal protein L13